MVSPLYIPMPDLFNQGIAARQAAQRDFANQLGQLYAGGNQQAGQALAGIAPEHANAIRQSLESMPESQLGQVKKRADLLKKWHFAINNEPDESTRALMYNQMLAQIQQSGGDVSGLAPQYSPQALQQQTQELMSFDDLVGMGKERRLRESAGGGGTMDERDRNILIEGDPNTQEWREVYKKNYLRAKRSFNPVTGEAIYDWDIADPETIKKAQSIGWPLNKATQELFDIESGAPGARLPGDVNPPAVPPAKKDILEVPPSVTVQPGQSRAEKEAINREERAAQREAEKGGQYDQDQKKSAGFAARMDQAAADVEGMGGYVPSLKDILAYKHDPTGWAGSEQSKLFLQAQENWISANLRKESGAVISTDEMEKEVKKYFPLPGDTDAVIKQKAESRRIASEAMRLAAGGAYTELKEKVAQPQPSEPAGVKFLGFE